MEPNALLVGEGSVVAVERHVAIRHVVAQNKESHCDVVVGRYDRTTAVLFLEHLEVVHDTVGDGFATVGAVSLNDAV